jgi:type I restriction enzyme S subunit
MSSDVAEMARASDVMPGNWREVSVADVVAMLPGFAFKSENFVTETDAGLPLIRIRDLGQINTATRYVGDYDEAFAVRDGDILVGMDGSFEAVRWRGGKALLNQRVLKLSSARPSAVDEGYLFYRVQPALVELEQTISGTTVKHLSTKDLKRLAWQLPPLDEQRRIAEVLRSVDVVLSSTTTALAKLKSVKSAVLRDIIEHDALPDGWVLTPIGDLGAKVKHAIVDGPFGSNLKSEHYRSTGIPVFQSGFVTSSHFKPTKYVFVDDDLFRQQYRSRAVGGDILMAKIGAQAGRCAIIPSDHCEGIIAGNCLKITVNPNQCSAVFLHAVLTYMYGITGLREIITETAQPAISLARLKTLLVPLPPLEEQGSIMEGIHSLDLSIEAETSKLMNLSDLKIALMSDLLSGKVRVPA